jgi:glucose/arabinose dehydrogenase
MKKKIVIGILLLFALVGGAGWWLAGGVSEPADDPVFHSNDDGRVITSAPRTELIAENLTVPWELLFLPDGELLVTERPGRVLLLRQGVELQIDGIVDAGEGGLLGAALHPDFIENKYLYLYQTTEDGVGTKNRIVRYVLENAELILDRVIMDNLPGALYHDGGRIAFGPDGYLYVAVGDALNADAAQDRETLEGTLLRMAAEGEPVSDNPFGTYVYSYGHRNAQGITWDAAGNLWSSEHGRSVGGSGFDEINLIQPGGNYGWPDSQGDTVAEGTVAPVRHSTADVTWAPGDLQFLDGSLYMPGLRGETLYEAVLDGTDIVAWHEHFIGEYGRLRSVRVGPDGLLYLMTSNRDGRGDPPVDGDDRIIRINPTLLSR